MILFCDLCATSWDTDDPNQDRRCEHSDELEQRAKLPDGYQPGCPNWHCPCWQPGVVCGKFMGYSRSRYCPRCGWTRELHKPKPHSVVCTIVT